ncbi:MULTISPECIES: MFS transporter [Pandoraea]|uniref:MFS transporter n=1 Tax=Pandoraea TaxID=93217 RepID=UPI001F5C0D14|nr:MULTISPECIES: MFS transporter [Pandoraea]MCI3205213.1 MFS transporter [Pandoraea sp. LA3]MDN4583241.1 MFS transporter [Pandoraea capi]
MNVQTPAQKVSPTALPLLVASTFFMENLDATIITTSIPAMARDFGVAPSQLSIGLSAYLVALAAFIPASGWLADRLGPRRVFPAAIALFTLASVLCAMSTSLDMFTVCRVLQGLAGAMMVPVGRLVVLRSTPKPALVRAIATITWPGLAAPVLGPALGGFISSTWSWHWIFLINVPLGMAAFAAALWLVKPSPGQRKPFDLAGFVASGVGASLLMFGVELASRTPADWPAVIGCLVIGGLAMAWSIRHFGRTSHPLLNLGAMRVQTFAVTVWGGSMFRIAIGSAPFLLPLMFQLAFGMSAVTSGLLMLALFAGNLGIKPATTPIMRRFGFRRVLLGNGWLVVVGFALCAMLSATTPLWIIALVLLFGGICRSVQFTTLATLAYADVPPADMSGASTLSSALQQMTTGMGIALGALVLKITEVAGVTPFSTASFRWTFVVMAGIALLAMIDGARLPADAGAQVSGHQPSPSR